MQGRIWCRHALALSLALDLLGCETRTRPRSRLQCTTAYGGERQVHDILATRAPYRVEPIAVGKRFLFQAVYVDDPDAGERVDLFVFTQDDPPKIIQEVAYRPPYPRVEPGAGYGFTGLVHVYTDTARELTYFCGFVPAGARPK